MSLPESLERAASQLDGLADQIRPANGDPHRLLEELSRDEAARLLGWILSEESDDAAELVEAWGESDDGANVLLLLPDDGIPKAGRKLLRKARHRLRSRGVEVAVADAAADAPRRVKPESDRFQAAHLSTPDFRGARMGYLVDSHPSGGARLFEARFDPARGILDFKIYNAGRSKVRGFLKSLTQGSSGRLFEVERDALRALVRRASQAQPADRPLPTAFVEWRSRLFDDTLEQQATPGDLARQALGAAQELSAEQRESALEAVCADIRAGRIGPWPPTTAWVSNWMKKAQDDVEGLEGAARGEAIDAWLDEVSTALAEETDAALLSHHLDELAWVGWQTDQSEEARALLAVSSAQGGDASVAKALARSRAEAFFGPFLTELRVVESSPLEDDAPAAAAADGR